MVRTFVTGAMAVLLVATSWAQDPQRPAFRSSVRTVPIYATVADTTGRLVPDLEQTDFEILDNRVEDNGIGIRSYSSSGTIQGNVLRRNGKPLELAGPVKERQNKVNPKDPAPAAKPTPKG